MSQLIAILTLLFVVVGCKTFEVTEANTASTSLASTASAQPTTTTPAGLDDSALPEPALPAKATVEPVAALTFDQVRQMPSAGTRPSQVKTDLDDCFSRIKQNITYDSIGATPLMPDSNNINVTGDAIVPNANFVSAAGVAGSLIVQRAEMVSNVTNLTGISASSNFVSRLVNSVVNVQGSLTMETWAINSLINAYGTVDGTSHVTGTISGGDKALDPNFMKAKVCLFSQEVESVNHAGGKVVLVGRGEAGDLGRVGDVSHIKGSVVTIGLSVNSFESITLAPTEYMYIESSNTSSIIGDLGGVIYLNGTKVDSLTNGGAGQTTVYLMNGGAVARITGNVKLVQQ